MLFKERRRLFINQISKKFDKHVEIDIGRIFSFSRHIIRGQFVRLWNIPN